MTSRKFLSYVPLLILALMLFYTVYRINTANTTVDENKLYLGIAAVFSGLIFQTVRPRIGKWITVVALLMGMLNWLVFTPTRSYIDLKLNSLRVEFNTYPFLIFILFIIINFQSVKRHMKWLLQEESPKETQEESEGQA